MKRNEVLSYVYDFARILMDDVSDEVNDIILFGSVARGNFDSESDVDIFVNVAKGKTKQIQAATDRAIKEFEIHSLHNWKLKGINLPIRCIVGDLKSKKWSVLKREIISSGIDIYGRYKELPKGLKRYFIFSFTLAKLKYKNRVNVVRKLYGYSTRKGKKLYAQAGILKKLGGEKLNPSVVLVPAESYKTLYEFFRSYGANFRVREAWMEQPS